MSDIDAFKELNEAYEVNFEKWPIRDEAENKILTQFRDKAAFVGFVRAVLQSCETLTDALLTWAQIRTAYEATETNLDALGRVVGWRRGDPIIPDPTPWFSPDYNDTAPDIDEAPVWVIRGALIPPQYMTDDRAFAYYIIAKAIRNHVQYCSVPEVVRFVKRITNLDVRIDKTAPDEVIITILNIATTDAQLRNLLSDVLTDGSVDKRYMINIPAGCHVANVFPS